MSHDPYGYNSENKDDTSGKTETNTPYSSATPAPEPTSPAYPVSSPPYPQAGPSNVPGVQEPYGPPVGQAPSSPYGYPQHNAGYPAGGYPAGQNGAPVDTWTEMKKPKNLSLIYGITSLVMLLLSTVLGFTFLVTLVTAPLGLIEAKKAKQQGENSTLAATLCWVSIGLLVLSALAILLFVVILASAFSLSAL